MLKDIWRVLTGTLSTEALVQMKRNWRSEHKIAEFQIKRANEAVRLYNECEIARKQSSDALGDAIIKQMHGDK